MSQIFCRTAAVAATLSQDYSPQEVTETETNFNKYSFYPGSSGPSAHLAALTNDSFLDFLASQSEPVKTEAAATVVTVYQKKTLAFSPGAII